MRNARGNSVLTGILLCFSVLITSAFQAHAQEPVFPDEDLEERIAQVNEGPLRVLLQPPAEPAHHHHNEIEINPVSLSDGWVRLWQCHTHLDTVPATQIEFNPERTKGLKLLITEHIDSSWVAGGTVQLRGIRNAARVCLEAQTRALKSVSPQHWRLVNGPFKRQFLDGYYPLRVTLDIRYPADLLQLHDYFPPTQPGLTVGRESGRIHLDGWFEGKLVTRFDFRRRR